jgi:outer membrane protein OmpA-like peptidoglycan-associated protein
MKARDERWQGELEENYANGVAKVKSEILVEVYKTVSGEGQAVRAEIRGEVSAAGEKVKDEIRQELTQVVGSSIEQIQLDKETLLETVKLQTAEIIQDEILKLKEEYANVSAKVLELDQVEDKVSEFANESMVLRNESKKILKEVQKHVAKNKKMIMAGENVVPNDTVKQMVDGWTVIQNEWKALETVCYRKMEEFQETHGSLERLTQSVETHQREYIKFAEQMRIDIGSADKFVDEVLPTVIRRDE